MKIKRVYIFSVMFIILGIYCGILYLLPVVLNSDFMVAKYETFLSSKLSASVEIKNFHFKSNPDLTYSVRLGELGVISDKIQKVECSKNEDVSNKILLVKNFEFGSMFLSPRPKKVIADSIYLDIKEFRKYLSLGSKKSKRQLNLSYFPIININNLYLNLDENGSYAQFNGIKSDVQNGKIYCNLLGQVYLSSFDKTLFIGKSGQIYYDNGLWFDKYSASVDNSEVFISGKSDDLNIKANKLSVNELEYLFLYFYKLKYPNKKNFIENFSKFKGTLDVDLKISSSGVFGKCFAKNLGADFSKYNIPVYFPLVEFNFEGRNLWVKTNGTFGTEPVYTDFYLSGLATNELETKGTVRSDLTDKFCKKYFNPVKITGIVSAIVNYHVRNKVVNVDYLLTVNKGSNIVLGAQSLGNIDTVRKISAHTLKQGEDIHIKNYSYDILASGSVIRNIINGNGLFTRSNGHFRPVNVSLKTNDFIEVSDVKSLIQNFFEKGKLSANIQYDFRNKNILGYVKLKNAYHKDFLEFKYVEADVAGELLKMNAEGEFFKSPIKIKLSADRNLQKGFSVQDIDIALDKFYVDRWQNSKYKPIVEDNKKNNSNNNNFDYDVTVQKGKIHVGEIIHSRFYLKDVEIIGKLNNNIVDFVIPQTIYAKGILSAVGKYDIVKHSSDINFLASDIDSNEVATKMFNLPNQIEGLAYATLHVITKDRLNDVNAFATFAVHDGFLPKLGSKEFIVNKSAKKGRKLLFFLKKPFKFTLSKISNIDFSKPNIFYSDLGGSFNLNNDEIKNAKIFSQSDYLSLFIEGEYNIAKEVGKIRIFGKHNKSAERRIKIFKLPLSLIYKLVFRAEHSKNLYNDKIKMIPPIKAKPEDIGIFRVFLFGNLNNNDIKVYLKDLR